MEIVFSFDSDSDVLQEKSTVSVSLVFSEIYHDHAKPTERKFADLICSREKHKNLIGVSIVNRGSTDRILFRRGLRGF